MTTTIKFVIILAIAVALASAIIIFVIPVIKKKKLAQGWANLINSEGGNVTEEQLRKGIDSLSNSEVNKLVDFSQKLKANDWTAIAAMKADMLPILLKAGLSTYIT